MNFSGVTTPVTTSLVTPIVPELREGAFVPGVPCPCPTNFAPLVPFGRGCQISEWPCPTGSDAAVISYYHADSTDGSDVDNNDCEVPDEEWELEEDKDAGAPPAATYRGDPYDISPFGLAQTAVYDSNTPYLNRDNYRYEVEWQWKIDLTEWPTTRTWPTGLIYKAALVWVQRVMLNVGRDDPETYTSTLYVEHVNITEENRIWMGEMRSTALSIGETPELTSRMFVEIVEGGWPILPFA